MDYPRGGLSSLHVINALPASTPAASAMNAGIMDQVIAIEDHKLRRLELLCPIG
jgi:hypothetical protein